MSKRYSFAQLTCIKKAGLALQKAAPLLPGARLGVAVSGGMDSLVMLKVLAIRQRILPFRTELMVLHCNPGFAQDSHKTMAAWLAREGIASHIETDDFGIVAHSEKNRKKSPCFLCAWLRRKKFFSLCAQYGLTHLAIGHNADDLLATFMLNFFRNGSRQSLPIAEKFFNNQLTLIRPMLLVEKKYIRQAARQWQLPVFANACPSNGKTARSAMENLLVKIDAELPGARRSALNALRRSALEETDLGFRSR